MNKVEMATKAFIEVKNFFSTNYPSSYAYRLAWKKPIKFYREHSKKDAIAILAKEANEIIICN